MDFDEFRNYVDSLKEMALNFGLNEAETFYILYVASEEIREEGIEYNDEEENEEFEDSEEIEDEEVEPTEDVVVEESENEENNDEVKPSLIKKYNVKIKGGNNDAERTHNQDNQ